jgi:hypothetical protein
MSTILKALKRLEEEKPQPAGRDLREEVAAAAPVAARPPSQRWLRWVGGLAVAVLAFGGGWLGVNFYIGEPGAEGSTDAGGGRAAPAVAAAAPGPRENTEPLGSVRVAPKPAIPRPVTGERTRVAVTGLSSVAEAAVPPAPSRAIAVEAPARTSELPVSSQPAASERQERVAPIVEVVIFEPPEPLLEEATSAQVAAAIPVSEPDSPETTPTDQVAESTPMRASAVVREPAPEQTIPVATRSVLPELRVLRTRWHPTPDLRIAELELTVDRRVVKLGEGDAIGPLVVKRITPSSVIFDHAGVEIQRRVGDTSSGG